MLKTIAMTTTLMAAGSQATFIHPLEEYDMAQIGVPGCPPHQTVVHDIEECRIVAEGLGMGLDWFADTNNDSHDPAGCFFGNFGGTRMAFFNSGRGTKHPARGSVCRTLTCEEGNRAYYGDKVYHLPDIGDGMLPESQRQYYYNEIVATPTCAEQERIYLDLAQLHSTCEQGNDRYWADRAYGETQGLHAQKQQAYDRIVALSTCAEQEVAYRTPGGVLDSGRYLSTDEMLVSANGQYRMVVQSDGNLVVYTKDYTPLWGSKTRSSTHPLSLHVQESDGNLVLYDAHMTPFWESDTRSSGPTELIMQDDGNLVLYRVSDYTPLWASASQQGSVSRFQGTGERLL